MSLSLSIVSYFTLWWTVLFAILPFGVRSQDETGEVVAGTEPGAPSKPMLLQKALWTTLVTTILFAGLWSYVTWASPE